jgi:hypothetical protein
MHTGFSVNISRSRRSPDKLFRPDNRHLSVSADLLRQNNSISRTTAPSTYSTTLMNFSRTKDPGTVRAFILLKEYFATGKFYK